MTQDTRNPVEMIKARLREVLLQGQQERGWSMRELSARANLSTNYIQQFMSGQRPNPTLDKLHQMLSVLDQIDVMYVMLGNRFTETDRQLLDLIWSLPDSLRPKAVAFLEDIAATSQPPRDRPEAPESGAVLQLSDYPKDPR